MVLSRHEHVRLLHAHALQRGKSMTTYTLTPEQRDKIIEAIEDCMAIIEECDRHHGPIYAFAQEQISMLEDLPASGWNFDMAAAPKQGIILVTNGRGTWPARWQDGQYGVGYHEIGRECDGKINGCTAWQPLPPAPRKPRGWSDGK